MAGIQVLELTNGGSFDRDNGISNRVVFYDTVNFRISCSLCFKTTNP